jgi:hypothetical protein
MLPDMEPSSELNSALTSKNKKVQQMNVQVDLRILLPEKVFSPNSVTIFPSGFRA